MADENELATKGDLKAGLDDLEKRLRAELASKDDLAALEQRLDAKMGAMENRLLRGGGCLDSGSLFGRWIASLKPSPGSGPKIFPGIFHLLSTVIFIASNLIIYIDN